MTESLATESRIGPDARVTLHFAIKLDDGRAISIVQAADETFRPGDRVRIISDGITARVTR